MASDHFVRTSALPVAICGAAWLAAGALLAGEATLTIDASAKGAELAPHMYGIFLEEINHGVDGGLYGELIRNRAFEANNPPEGAVAKDGAWWNHGTPPLRINFQPDPTGLPYWHAIAEGGGKGRIFLDDKDPLHPNTPHSMGIEVTAATGRVGAWNEGYWGIPATAGGEQRLSLHARCIPGFKGPLVVYLESEGQRCSEEVSFTGIGEKWQQFTATLKGTRDAPKARLVVEARSTGTVWLDMVSLFPAKTFKNRPNGLRPDIAQLIADLKPSFVRFPGGCVVEGNTAQNAYNWKWTLGPLVSRKEAYNAWDYRRTHGVGYHEYLQFCEDIGAEPMFISFIGETCYFRCCERVPMDQMGWVIDNAVDALEYANGPADSKWGRLRAEAGHPQPFNMKYFGIGNENWLEGYIERYVPAFRAIKAKFPEVQTIACVDHNKEKVEIVDHHNYNASRYFVNNLDAYDKYDRSKPPVFVGEYSTYARDSNGGQGLIAGLTEAAWTLGLERNADVVRLVCYAPLLAHVNGRTGWHGMIYFDSTRTYCTPSYYVQKLFSLNRPTTMVKADYTSKLARQESIPGNVGVDVIRLHTAIKDVRVQRGGTTLLQTDFAKDTGAWKKDAAWKVNEGALETEDHGWANAGDPSWSDYAVSLRMRWIKGHDPHASAFILKAGISDRNWIEWKIDGGGKNSVVFACDRGFGGAPVDVTDGKWHDMRMEYEGLHVKCLLDGKLIHDYRIDPLFRFHANAGIDATSGDLIVKAVNTSPEQVQAAISLKGIGTTGAKAEVWTLASPGIYDENSLERPDAIVPVRSTCPLPATAFKYSFQPNSMTVMRIPTR